MEDHDLDDALRQALSSEGAASERVWQKSRRTDPPWLPSVSEIAFAALVGVVSLTWLAWPQEEAKFVPVVRRGSPFERTYLASTRMETTIP